jgi:molybdopterin converting factor small subunit
MKVTIHYMAQLKQAAGTGTVQLEFDGGCTVSELARRLAAQHGEPFRRLVLDEKGGLQATNLFFIGDTQVQPSEAVALKDGDVVTLLSPIAGGA